MSKELQKVGYGTTRSSIEAGNKDVVREPIYLSTPKELSVLYNSTRYHFPSQERMATGIASPTYPESISSGARLIGVSGSSFSILSGNTDLQSVLNNIDSLLNAFSGLDNVILKDGSVDMEEDWNMQKNLTVNNPDLIDFDAGGRDLNVVGNLLVADPSSLYSSNIRNGDFASDTYWTYSPAWSITGGKAVCDVDSGSGSIWQTAGNLLAYFSSEMWYILEYTISDYYKEDSEASVSFYLSPSSEFVPESSVFLPLSNGTHKVAFKTIAGTPVLDTRGLRFGAAVSSGQLTFKLDDVSVKAINKSGDMDIVGNLNFTFGAVPRIGETTTPATKTNYASIYPKADDKAYWLDGAGTEHELGYYSSGTFEGQPEGFTSHGTVTYIWHRIGNIVFISLMDPIWGTSNATYFYAAAQYDIPAALRPTLDREGGTCICTDNGVNKFAECVISVYVDGTIAVLLDGGWTSSGNKGINYFTICYPLD